MGNPICMEHKPYGLMVAVERDRYSKTTYYGKKMYGIRKYWKCKICGRLKQR